MSHPHKLSLSSAILINLNIMLGAGIFVNTVLLAQQAGAFGALAYLTVGIILLPLMLSIARLVSLYQGGTFYEYGASIHPLIGFISSWSYFVAKLGSCALGIHVFVTLMQTIFPVWNTFPAVTIDCGIVILFMLLNSLNMRIGKSIQYSFMALKLIPILFAIGAGAYLFSGNHMALLGGEVRGLIAAIPFVLYAFTGFEATCSLSRSLRNPKKDGPRAILFAYCGGVFIVVLYQLFFYGAFGPALGELGNFRFAFPALVDLLGISDAVRIGLIGMLQVGAATSALGAAYGIMYSNGWNLFALSQQNFVFGSSRLRILNKYHIPFLCVVIEAMIALGYILLSQGNQIPLQQIVACGMTLTYTASVLGLLVRSYRERLAYTRLAAMGLGSCLLFIVSLMRNVVVFGIMPIALFILLLVIGGSMFFYKKINSPLI